MSSTKLLTQGVDHFIMFNVIYKMANATSIYVRLILSRINKKTVQHLPVRPATHVTINNNNYSSYSRYFLMMETHFEDGGNQIAGLVRENLNMPAKSFSAHFFLVFNPISVF